MNSETIGRGEPAVRSLWQFFGLLGLLSLGASAAGLEGTPLSMPDPSSGRPGFRRLEPAVTGLTFSHSIPPARHLTNQMLLDGSGVALADVDGDGRVDVFLAACDGGSQLWRNEGDWHFREITAAAFPQRTNQLSSDVTGAAFADLNGDGTPDLILNSHANGIRVLLNDGRGVFSSLSFPQAPARGGHSLALADVDGDGWVDIYVCNYRQKALMDMPSARATFQGVGPAKMVATIDGRPTTAPDLTNRFVVTPIGGIQELGEPDVLYCNFRGTNFAEVTWTSGAFLDEEGHPLPQPPRDWGLAAQFCDFNDDGRPDLYVCNDFQTPDRFWLNESSPGTIRFRLIPRAGLRHTSLFSMGVDFADINRDGRWDFIVLDMLSADHVRRLTTLDDTRALSVDSVDPLARPQTDANTLFLQRPGGSFAEVAAFAGVTATDWSWTPAFMDVDLDGWPDLLISAGQERGSRDLDGAEHMKAFRRAGLRTDAQILRERQKFPPLPAPLRAFRNRGVFESAGIPVFEEVSTAWGFDFVGVSHGLALGDLDGDGDLDVVVNHLNAPAGLYRNESGAPRVAVRLTGRPPNTTALGARLRFWWNPGTPQPQELLPQSAQIFAGGRYLSSDDRTKTFACPGSGRGSLEIRWPSGQLSTVTNLAANQLYVVQEPEDAPSLSARVPTTIRPRLRFEAQPNPLPGAASTCDDFGLQPLLPRRQSTRSPALAYRSDAPGRGQLWIGGGPDQPIRQVTLSDGRIESVRAVGPGRPSVALTLWGDDLLVADGSCASGGADENRVCRVDPRSGSRTPIGSTVRVPSCLSLSSLTPAQDVLLFVGGGGLPGIYPNSSPSEVLRFDGAAFRSVLVTNLGLVTASAFADLDGDGRLELITTSEWGTPRIFRWREAVLEGWDAPVQLADSTSTRLSALTGWWQSLATADVDHDGRSDLVLGNWGLNSAYALYTGAPPKPGGGVRPLVLFHGGSLEAGPGACLEAYTGTDGRLRPIHGLTELSPHFPWLAARFSTYRAFAEATVEEILGDKLRDAGRLECRWLSSLVLLNRGDHFEARALPEVAQLGPIMALATGDFDGDGRPDFYAAQGFFGHNFGVLREDAGEGIFLLNRGDGSFETVTTAEAGARRLGEQRAALALDFDGDNRPDLIVGEHGGPVTFLRNLHP